MQKIILLAFLSLLLTSCDVNNDNNDTNNLKVEIWVIDNNNDQISTLNQTDGTITYQFSAPGGIRSGGIGSISGSDSNHGLAWDGEYIWIYHLNSDTLFKCDLNGTVIQEFSFPQLTFLGLVFADGFLWAIGGSSIYKINPVDGSWNSYPSLGGGSPRGIAYDGVSKLWVVGSAGTYDIYTYDVLTGETIYQFDSSNPCAPRLEYYNEQLLIIGCDGLHTVDPNTGAIINSLSLPYGYFSGLTLVSRNANDPINEISSERPIADAGPDQVVPVGDTVVLDGSGSSDSENDPLTYRWGFADKQSGSTATFSDATLMSTVFTPDQGGIYNIRLTVNDGFSDSIVDQLDVVAESYLFCQSDSICGAGGYCQKPEGSCDTLGGCASTPTICIALIDEVCGCNGVTYNNSCEAAADGVNVLSQGAC